MSRITIVSLDATQHIDQATIGPKAMSLIRLNRIGLTVPRGFCIPAIVCQEHLERNDLIAYVEATVDKLAEAEPQAKASILADLRAAITRPPLAQDLQREIETHYRALSAAHVAVRSSGTAEDLPGHSFAGQYDTYLGIGDLSGCIEAIKKCWASLWTLRAYEYRQKNGFDHLKIGMAVIIQTLISADVSGVIFTADPLTGGRGRIIIEACFGLGEALVSGKVTPDRFIVGNRSYKIFTRLISEKRIAHRLAESGLVEELAIPREMSSVCCLDNKQIKKLAKLAKKVETKFGCPQDIEWAIHNGQIFFLQSRPITALPPQKSWQERQIWCCNPAKEVMPDVVTPMTSSVIDALLGSFIDPIFGLLCMDRGEHPIYGLIAGRIYFNANIWGAVVRDLPGTGDLDFMKLAGGYKGIQKVIDKLRNADDEDLPDMKFKRYKFFLKIPLLILGAMVNTPNKSRRILARAEAENERLSRLKPESHTDEELAALCEEIMMKLTRRLELIINLLSVLGALPVLEIVCDRWLLRASSAEDKSKGSVKARKLLAGMGNMVDAVAGLDIWRLAAISHSKQEIRGLILSNKDWHTIEKELRRDDSGIEFLTAWNQFMLAHGHHCRGELELYNKRWAETPDYVLKFVRTHISQMDIMDAVRNFAAAGEQRRQLEQECRKQLRNPIKRIIFNFLLARAQYGSAFRENIKSEVIKLLTTMRKLLIELGKKLADKGVLEKADDIFFLRQEEISPVVNDKAQFDFHKVIAARRAEYDKNSSVTPPDVVFGQFDPDSYLPDTQDEHTEILNGLGVSPGKATGKARVILRTDSDQQLLAGEILVAPFTDPGWTPYFVPAVAIVMDEGGVISHGSIVAREYGIPAVVNVGCGTRIIKTGQMIQVDGDSGVVRIVG